MGARERCVLGRRQGLRHVMVGIGYGLRQKSVARGDDAQNDERHAEIHIGIHGHAGQHESHVSRHPEHRQVEHDADGDHERAEPERERAAPLRIHKAAIWRGHRCPPPSCKCAAADRRLPLAPFHPLAETALRLCPDSKNYIRRNVIDNAVTARSEIRSPALVNGDRTLKTAVGDCRTR